MNKLDHPDLHYLRAAEGWLGLGDPASAGQELDQINSAWGAHPDVLMMHCDIFVAGKRWDALLPVAEALFRTFPENLDSWLQCSFALHQLRRTREAFDLLRPAVEKFTKSWFVPYNLACYSTQLGRLKEGWQWLQRTLELCPVERLRLAALKDPDLEPLWPEIAELSTALQQSGGRVGLERQEDR